MIDSDRALASWRFLSEFGTRAIWVTEGIGLCHREGGPIEIIRPGDRVFFEPGENHWHCAAPTRFMTHIAIALADESGSHVTFGRHVSDDEYARRRRREPVKPGEFLGPSSHEAWAYRGPVLRVDQVRRTRVERWVAS